MKLDNKTHKVIRKQLEGIDYSQRLQAVEWMLAQRVYEEKIRTGLKYHQMAVKCDLSSAMIRKILTEAGDIRLSSLVKLSCGLEISLHDFFTFGLTALREEEAPVPHIVAAPNERIRVFSAPVPGATNKLRHSLREFYIQILQTLQPFQRPLRLKVQGGGPGCAEKPGNPLGLPGF